MRFIHELSNRHGALENMRLAKKAWAEFRPNQLVHIHIYLFMELGPHTCTLLWAAFSFNVETECKRHYSTSAIAPSMRCQGLNFGPVHGKAYSLLGELSFRSLIHFR